MPKYALLLITKQDGSKLNYSEFAQNKEELQCNSNSFAIELEKLKIPEYERLNWTAYLVSLSSGLETLIQFHTLAEKHQVAIKTLFFEEEPSWITSLTR